MNRKYETMKGIKETGVVAVIRGEGVEETRKVIDSCLAGGVNIIEVTYTNPYASEIIKSYMSDDSLILGAGSVLDATTARIAILSGARFIVSPNFNTEIAKLCNTYTIPYIPGCMTITEMTRALEMGVEVVKLFPASNFTPDFIKAVKAPLPQIDIMPTGGVNSANIGNWIEAGAIACGLGGALTKGEGSDITNYAKECIQAVKTVKK